MYDMDPKLTTLNLCVVLLALVALGEGQNVSTTTTSIEEECLKRSSSCSDCISMSKCVWCESSEQKCRYYTSRTIIPPASWCPLKDIKLTTCYVNLEILIIVCATLAGIVLITACLCVYCCCCRGKKGISRRELREEQAQNAETEERRTRHAERRAERQARWDEIRQKYGLSSASNTGATYSRFNNEASEA